MTMWPRGEALDCKSSYAGSNPAIVLKPLGATGSATGSDPVGCRFDPCSGCIGVSYNGQYSGP